jgi:hypothetical protein
VVHEAVAHEAPEVILKRLAALDEEIRVGMRGLEGMLK